MTTDRTQPARPAALNDRSSAAPAERRPEGAFAALLDAHAPAPAPRREEPQARRDDVRDRGPEPRDAAPRHDQTAGAAPDGSARDAGGHEQPQGERPAAATAVLPVAEPAAAPVALPVEAAGRVGTDSAPVLPTAPFFMVAPEALVAAAPVAPQTPAVAPPAVEAAAPVAPAPPPGAPVLPATATATQPAAAAPAPVALPVEDGAPAPAPAAAPAAAPQAATPEAPKTPERAAPVAAAPVAPETPAAPEAHANAPARAAAAAPEPAPAAAPAAQAPATEPFAPAPVSTPAPGLAAPERAVPLYRAPAAVATLLQVAVDRGISHARMTLRPAELGGIEIRLQVTAAGVAAQVVADSPEAARLLAQAGDDLRRALEARDVTLISLDVSTSSDEKQQSARGEWTDGEDAGLTSSPGRAAGDAEGDAEPAPITQTVIELPGGLLVDVLA